MSEKKFEVYDLKVNQITEALGMDVEKPVFSWKLRAEKQNTMQKQAQILVEKTAGSAGVWDSGVMDTDESAGIAYAGEALEAETRYYVTVKVWDQDGEEAETSSWFETGLMSTDRTYQGWSDAKWIGGGEDDRMLYSHYLPVFKLNFSLQLDKISRSTRAGFIYGANDERLMGQNRNL